MRPASRVSRERACLVAFQTIWLLRNEPPPPNSPGSRLPHATLSPRRRSVVAARSRTRWIFRGCALRRRSKMSSGSAEEHFDGAVTIAVRRARLPSTIRELAQVVGRTPARRSRLRRRRRRRAGAAATPMRRSRLVYIPLATTATTVSAVAGLRAAGSLRRACSGRKSGKPVSASPIAVAATRPSLSGIACARVFPSSMETRAHDTNATPPLMPVKPRADCAGHGGGP